jgi:hypothetical protein
MRSGMLNSGSSPLLGPNLSLGVHNKDFLQPACPPDHAHQRVSQQAIACTYLLFVPHASGSSYERPAVGIRKGSAAVLFVGGALILFFDELEPRSRVLCTSLTRDTQQSRSDV